MHVAWTVVRMRRPRKAVHASERGVTVIEVSIAGALLAIVGVVGAVVFVPQRNADDNETAIRDATRIQRAASEWQQDHEGDCPTLTELARDRRLSHESRTDDPWGERFRVTCADGEIRVSSPGRDGKPNTADDIRVPKG